MEDSEPELLDMLMANGFMLEVFMLQMSLEMARQQPDPQAWARAFIETLHHRMDSNEGRVGELAQRYPVHELSRLRIDQLGQALTRLLQLPRR